MIGGCSGRRPVGPGIHVVGDGLRERREVSAEAHFESLGTP